MAAENSVANIRAAAYALQAYRGLAQRCGPMTRAQAHMRINRGRRARFDRGVEFLLRTGEMWLDDNQNLMLPGLPCTPSPPEPSPPPAAPALGEDVTLHITVDGVQRQLGYDDVQAMRLAWRAVMRQGERASTAGGKFTPASVRRSARYDKRDACELGLKLLGAIKMIELDDAGEIATVADPWL